MEILVLLGIIFFLISLYYNSRENHNQFQKSLLKQISKVKDLKEEKRSLTEKDAWILNQLNEIIQLKKDYKTLVELTKEENHLLLKTIEDKDKFFESLKNKTNTSVSKITSLYSDFLLIQYDKSAAFLRLKKRPAKIEAKRIEALKKETKNYLQQYRQMLYKYEYLLQLFPELENYVDSFEAIQQLENIKSIEDLKEEYDYVQTYLTKEEFKSLDINQRNQLALDRYLKGQKTNWQVGRDYELYCGREYELNGWNVEYVGMEKKLQDLGRDLIAIKNNEIHVVQCKYWAHTKVIHEKHIAQLFGTVTVLGLDKDPSWTIIPVFITNVELSDTAQKFASKLNVKVIHKKLEDFPRIKCNVTKSENGELSKIYHLPFDQQYDKTRIKDKEEFYASTVEEAVSKGFRRAFKYYGSN